MKFFVGSIILILILAFYAYRYTYSSLELPKKHDRLIVISFFAFALFLRTVVSYYNFSKGYMGFEVDINAMKNLGQNIVNNGLFGYYSIPDSGNYMPLYLMISGILGHMVSGLSQADSSSMIVFILRIPAILADCGIAYLAYRLAGKNNFRKLPALLVSALIVFNPTLLLGSSVWGQHDSVYALLLVMILYFACEGKNVASYIIFALAVLYRPQAVFFAPIVIFILISSLIKEVSNNRSKAKKDNTKLIVNIAGFVSSVCIFFIVAALFGTKTVLQKAAATFGEFKYSSVNAYNFWTLIGLNWKEDTGTFTWGVLLTACVIAFAVVVLVRGRKDRSSLFVAAQIILVGMFTLCVRMHERYLLPAVAVALFAYILRPKKEQLISFLMVTVVSVCNIFHVEYFSEAGTSEMVRLVCVMDLLAFGYSVYVAVRYYVLSQSSEKESQSIADAKKSNEEYFARMKDFRTSFLHAQGIRRMQKKDYIAVAVIMVVYSVFAFIRLGDTEIPSTEYSFTQQGPVVMDLGSDRHVSEIWFYNGHKAWRDYVLAISNDGENWEWLKTNEDTLYIDADYRWQRNEFDFTARYIQIGAAEKNDLDETLEIVIRDSEGNAIVPVNSADYQALFDEQEYAVEAYSFMNGTYWDEVYYTNTVYEMLHGIQWYENTHPHLGKEIMAIGVMMFGVNPFGWRFMPTLCGVIMLFAFYVLALRMFKETKWAVLATTVFAADFMHFMQTRVATIDVYAVLFIIASFIFMHDYTQLNFYEAKLRETFKPLALCGLFMGCGIASKWIGVYSAMGLAVIFFIQFAYRYREYSMSLGALDKDRKSDRDFGIVKMFNKRVNLTVLFCISVFVLVPLVIYVLSYIPFNDGVQGRGLIERVIESQKTMFNYHSQLKDTHFYASDWYQWPLINHPLRYVNEQVTETTIRVISLMGNPAIWWAGIPASLYMVYLWINEKDRKALFLTIGYLAQYLPWILVPRYTFIYHYFASVPFITIMIVYSLQRITANRPKLKWLPYAYCALCVILFLMFYPAMSGLEVPNSYIEFLKWSDGWFI